MRSKTLLATVTLLSLGFGLGWMASVRRFDRHGGPHARRLPSPEFFEALGLTADQRSRIGVVADEGRRKEAPLVERIEAVREELEEGIARREDRQRLRDRYALVVTAKQALETNHFETMMSVHEILTPEQVRELKRRLPPPGKGPRRK